MPTHKNDDNRIAFLQDTLELLILRVLFFGACHDHSEEA